MSVYSVYLFETHIELYPLEQEHLAVTRKGRLVSTQKDYRRAWESAVALSRTKQLPLVDRAWLLP